MAGVARFIHATPGKWRFIFENRVYPLARKLAEAMIDPDLRFVEALGYERQVMALMDQVGFEFFKKGINT